MNAGSVKKRVFAMPLATQRDGRKYAVEVLQELDDTSADEATAIPFDPDKDQDDPLDDTLYYREGPQWDGLYLYVKRLFEEGTPEAHKGFLAIFTDCFASSVGMNLTCYRRWEKQGKFQDLGRPGKEMPLELAFARSPRQMRAAVSATSSLTKKLSASSKAFLDKVGSGGTSG
jgi:hypothetical protein